MDAIGAAVPGVSGVGKSGSAAIKWLSTKFGFNIKKVVKGLSFSSGSSGEKYLSKLVGGSKKPVYFATSQGARYVDVLKNGFAHESKVGYTTLTNFVKKEILKDAELMEMKKITGVTWHFFRSDLTGQIGASKPLLKFLREHGINYIIHYWEEKNALRNDGASF